MWRGTESDRSDDNLLFHKIKTKKVFFFPYLQVSFFISKNVELTQETTLLGPTEKFLINFTLKGFISFFFFSLHHCVRQNIERWLKDEKKMFRVFLMKMLWTDVFRATHTFCSSGIDSETNHMEHFAASTGHLVMNMILVDHQCKLTPETIIYCIRSCCRNI